jgi:hypothetical protein
MFNETWICFFNIYHFYSNPEGIKCKGLLIILNFKMECRYHKALSLGCGWVKKQRAECRKQGK